MNNFFDSVKVLRQETLASFNKCKEALEKTGGDLEKAKEFLKKSNAIVADKKSSNQTEYGVCAIQTNPENTKAALITLCCETSSSAQNFVLAELASFLASEILNMEDKKDIAEILNTNTSAGISVHETIKQTIGNIGENINLQRVEIAKAPHISYYVHNKAKDSHGNLIHNAGATISLVGFEDLDEKGSAESVGKDIAMHIAGTHRKPRFVKVTEISDQVMEEYKKPILDQVMQQFAGKPQNVINNILSGKLADVLSEEVLELQRFIRNDAHTIESFAKENGVKIHLFHIVSAKR